MNEEEWLAQTDPHSMLWHLKGKDTDRKMRLFGTACCRLVWDTLSDQRYRDAIEIAERYADGIATASELSRAKELAKAAMFSVQKSEDIDPSDPLRGELISLLASPNVSADLLAWLFNQEDTGINPLGNQATSVAQADVLRDLYGTQLFRNEHASATWFTEDVLSISNIIYTERVFGNMAILADALEEAGCTSQNLLEHCRAGILHVRGCWAIDLLLQRN